MTPKEVTTEINMPTEVFISNLKEKIQKYERGTMDSLFNIDSSLQWDNITLKGNKIVIVKSMRPFGTRSSDTGTIESEIVESDNRTILKTKIILDTALFILMKYTVGIGAGMIGLTWLILDFNFFVLGFVLLIEGFVFGIAPRIHQDGLDGLTTYYYKVIRALTEE